MELQANRIVGLGALLREQAAGMREERPEEACALPVLPERT